LDNFPVYKFLGFFLLYLINNYKEIKKIDKVDEINKFDKMKIIQKLDDELRNFLIENKIVPEKEKINYPSHLEELIENRINDWSHSDFNSKFEYKANKNYIITKDEKNNLIIQPIDYSNAGIIQQSFVCGLHQFLQIKHGLRLTDENLNMVW